MIRHVLLFRFYPIAPRDAIDAAIRELRVLGSRIPEVREWSIGRDVGANHGRNYDLAQVSSFDDYEALLRYKAHPEHIRARDILSEIADWAAVDYET